MWILGIGTREQRAAIAEYFNNPSMTPGNATMAPPSHMGPGGASDSAVQLGGAMDLSHGPGKDRHNGPVGVKATAQQARQEAERIARAQDKARLENLMQQLHAAIENSQALAPFKDQLLIDITPEGLRIQIVDKLNRPMFDLGSAELKPYTAEILHELAGFIERVPNKISIAGHTDIAAYGSDRGYSNWELSADRANAARRALLAGGLHDDKTVRVVGLAASVPFDKGHPDDPTNRRISIIVMTQQAEDAALSQELVEGGPPEAKPKPMLPALPALVAPLAQARGVRVPTKPAPSAP
jgi:chemotaxis protein MotB